VKLGKNPSGTTADFVRSIKMIDPRNQFDLLRKKQPLEIVKKREKGTAVWLASCFNYSEAY
jgi:hypothetical protein